jgi:hypothetical protein
LIFRANMADMADMEDLSDLGTGELPDSKEFGFEIVGGKMAAKMA